MRIRIITDGKRICPRCEQVLPMTSFGLRVDGKPRKHCRPCRNERERKRYMRATCIDCGSPAHHAAKRCNACNGRHRSGENHPNYVNGRSVSRGYVYLSGYQGHPNANEMGRIAEHHLIMSEMLERPLREDESVHHKNGIRGDNRPENLELWSRFQPSGQRIEDLLEWAHEIINRYEEQA